MNISKLLQFLFLFTLATGSSSSFFPKWRVHIVNQLGSHKNLEIHCKSKGEDKGYHVIAPTEEYSWGFHVLFIFTLYFCNLWQGPGWKHHVVFDSFRASQEFVRGFCDPSTYSCTWIARDDGIYSVTQDKQVQLRYKWESVAAAATAAAATHATDEITSPAVAHIPSIGIVF